MNARPISKCPLCGAEIIDDGSVLVDIEGGLVVAAGHIVRLSASEFEVFHKLWESHPRVVGKDALMAATAELAGLDDREIKIIDVFVHKVRRRIAPLGLRISTVWGRGYRIETGRDSGE